MNSIVISARPGRKLTLGLLLLFPDVALLISASFKLGHGRPGSDSLLIIAFMAVLCAIAVIWVRFLSEKIEITDSALILSDCFGSRSLAFKNIYRVGLGYWGRGGRCVAVTDPRMKVIRIGRLFSTRMIDDVVNAVSVRARELVW